VLLVPVADVEDVLLLARPLVLPVELREEVELDDGDVAAVLFVLEDWSLLATAPVEDAVLEVEPLLLPVEAKPLVEPVWLSELLDVADGEAALVELLEDWSFEATALLVDDEDAPVAEVVLGAELAVLPPFESLLAKPLVLPVWLKELVALDDGEAAAVLLVFEDWSLLAMAPVEDAVLEVEPLELPVEAKPLVEPVWLREVLELLDGEDEARPELLEELLFWSVPDSELVDEVEPEDAIEPALAELLLLFSAVEFWLVDGVVELLPPEEFSVLAPLIDELLFVLLVLFSELLLLDVSLALALPLMEPEAEPETLVLLL
jgi:hypothetical protein